MNRNLNLFATVLTYPAPSSNYRGESEENRTVLQKVTENGKDYSIISPESMRNALREMLAKAGLPNNRRRLRDYLDKDGKPQLAVEFREFPNPEEFADDFLFGFMVADKEAVKKHRVSKRDSVFRMNMAVSLTPYRFNAVFHQSPLNAELSPWKNSPKSGLVYREVNHTAYQYPFALSAQDCRKGKLEWTKALLNAIGQLTDVAGGHARSYYEMSPRSIIARLTPSLIAGYDTYGFDDKGDFLELARINFTSKPNNKEQSNLIEENDDVQPDLPGDEFWVGGEIVRKMSENEKTRLKNLNVRLYDNPERLLTDIGKAFLETE